MRLLRLADVETSPNDHVCYRSRGQALVFLAVALSVAVALTFHAFTASWNPGYYLAAVDVLVVALYRRFIGARFRASNWLVRMNDLGLFIQFRSYLNHHLPADDFTVVFIAFQEIRLARLVRELVRTPNDEGGTSTQTLRYIELELQGDTTGLAKALATEVAAGAPKERRWYGTSAALYPDHPVRMQAPLLRMRWQVVPSAQEFLDALRPHAAVVDPVSLARDFTHLESLSSEEQQNYLRDLAQRGQNIAAISMARKLYGCGLAEAKQMVDGLTSENSNSGGSSKPGFPGVRRS